MNVRHVGGCHCGAVRFEVSAPSDIQAIACNCSICNMTGFLHLIASKDDFALISGQEYLTSYRFNTGTANHLFCNICGVKSFYVPRSHPDGYSVNVNCLDRSRITSIKTTDFDGAEWEQNIEKIQ